MLKKTDPIFVEDNEIFDYYGLKNDHSESELIVDDHRGEYIRDETTAENLAKYLFQVIAPELVSDTDIFISKIVVWETENAFATVN